MPPLSSYSMVVDFDGTAAAADVQQVILDALADPLAWRSVNREWADGKLTTKQRAELQWQLVSATEQEVLNVVAQQRLDPGFASFAAFCHKHHYPLTIVSDGFDFYIHPMLRRAGLDYLPVVANSLWYADGVPQMRFCLQRSPDQYYGNDKTVVMEQLRAAAATVVFVGDGYSDRDAAHQADMLFAKDRLAEYCNTQNLSYVPFETFFDVQTHFIAQR